MRQSLPAGVRHPGLRALPCARGGAPSGRAGSVAARFLRAGDRAQVRQERSALLLERAGATSSNGHIFPCDGESRSSRLSLRSTGLSCCLTQFFTGCLTKDVTRHFVNETLDRLLSPYPHSLLKRMELAQTVPARVAGLELNEQFECGLIRSLVQTARHLLPMIFEDLRAPAPRFITEPSIRFGADDNAARKSISTPQIDAPQECLVLPGGKSPRELNAQLVEKLRGIDVGEAFKSPANDRPYHAKRLDAGLARLGVDGLQLHQRLRRE